MLSRICRWTYQKWSRETLIALNLPGGNNDKDLGHDTASRVSVLRPTLRYGIDHVLRKASDEHDELFEWLAHE